MSSGKKTCAKKHKSRYRDNKKLMSRYGPKYIDQIKAEMEKQHFSNGGEEFETAGGAAYCVECDRVFFNEDILSKHKSTKAHKKRVRNLAEEQHTTGDAERAAGLISY